MVRIQEQAEEDDAHPQTNQPSSSNMNNSIESPSSPHPPQHESLSSPSSISSDHTFHGFSPPISPTPHALVPAPVSVPVPIVSASRLIRDHPEVITKTESEAKTGFAGENAHDGPAGRADMKPRRPPRSVLSQARTEKLMKRAGLGFRLCAFVVCLVSFSVMASDKRRGWALDSFDRYIEFRYSMTVNVIGFAYSGLQALDLLRQLTTRKNLVQSQLRHCFDFVMDQILAYLLLSSSSSAFTRVDDWVSNWGKDKFPAMASASVGVSFLAFIAFALSSLVSGYTLCTH